MNRRILSAFLLGASVVTLSLSTPAGAVLETVEEAYELTLLQVRMPASSADSVVIRTCATCEPVRLRVNAQTTYRLAYGEAPVSLAEMNSFIGAIADRQDTAVAVFYEPESLVVTRIVLATRGR
jgi:hypothetical protein